MLANVQRIQEGRPTDKGLSGFSRIGLPYCAVPWNSTCERQFGFVAARWRHCRQGTRQKSASGTTSRHRVRYWCKPQACRLAI